MKIKVLLVIPGKEVQIVKLPSANKFIKSFIGKNLYKISLDDETALIASHSAQLEEFNRIYKGDIIFGSFLVIGTKNNHNISLKKKQIRKFTNMFKLNKHQKKIEKYKQEFLEEFYFNQKLNKQKNAVANKNQIFNVAA
ncbi:MAG: hypothetical protein HFJ30_00700 [Clostridia bacterium]|jgi:hypothetical protein|nr:hypothetical protein [Clostridia bacterium]